MQRSNTPLPPRVALTSALHGEGVTFMTRSLASVLAYDTTESVVIVDLNWTRPVDGGSRRKRGSAEPKHSPDDRPTLIDAVEDRATLDDAIRPTANPRLFYVVAGALAAQRRSAIAGSPELEKLVDQIASRFDRVLLDLPPVMASSDAITLSHLAHAFLLVVHFGVTTDSQVDAALQELRSTPRLGVVLNKFDSSVPAPLRRVLGT
jgi:Mrp family chromosome partitioning ATPase